jgi:hypothetical protein
MKLPLKRANCLLPDAAFLLLSWLCGCFQDSSSGSNSKLARSIAAATAKTLARDQTTAAYLTRIAAGMRFIIVLTFHPVASLFVYDLMFFHIAHILFSLFCKFSSSEMYSSLYVLY